MNQIDFENIVKTSHLFWDISPTCLDVSKNKRIIIERFINLGDIQNIRQIVQFYGIETIKQEIVNAGFLDKKTLSWLEISLGIQKNQFKCYTKIQSKEVHWNF